MNIKGVLLPSAALGAAVLTLALRSQEQPVLLADGSHVGFVYNDQDDDGIPDDQEVVMGTNPLAADTDNDSYDDLEEFARQSDPSDPSSIPVSQRVGVGLASREEGGVFFLSSAFYLEDSKLDGSIIQLGMMIDGELADLPSSAIYSNATISVHEGHNPEDSLIYLQSPLPSAAIHNLGFVSVWSTVTPPGELFPMSSDALNVVSDPGGKVVLEFDVVEGSPPGGVYTPITVPADIPASWRTGEICMQASINVGNIGPVVQHLIEAASCAPADAFCSPTCSNLAGGSIQVVDPIALLGG